MLSESNWHPTWLTKVLIQSADSLIVHARSLTRGTPAGLYGKKRHDGSPFSFAGLGRGQPSVLGFRAWISLLVLSVLIPLLGIVAGFFG